MVMFECSDRICIHTARSGNQMAMLALSTVYSSTGRSFIGGHVYG